MEKNKLRHSLLAKRLALSEGSQAESGLQAFSLAKQLISGQSRVMIYLPFRAELNTRPVADWLFEQGGEVAVPLTDKTNRILTPALISSFSALHPAAYGILEPRPGSYEAVSPLSLNAVLVPALAFDRQGYRLGYGGGYYDRFLPRVQPSCLTIGYGYDWQLLEGSLPLEPWDLPLNYLVTDRQIMKFASPTVLP